jgi:hypothetical protein
MLMQKNHGDFKSEVRIHLAIKVTKIDAFYGNIKRVQLTLQNFFAYYLRIILRKTGRIGKKVKILF